MGVNSKSGKVRVTAHKRAAKKTPGRPGHRVAIDSEAREQTAQFPDERDDEIDCQRVVQGDGSRSLPLYYDDYN